MKSNKSISWIFFWPNSIFCNFKNGQESIFELRKSLKMQFQVNNFLIYLIWRVFLLGFFKIFWPAVPHYSRTLFNSIFRYKLTSFCVQFFLYNTSRKLHKCFCSVDITALQVKYVQKWQFFRTSIIKIWRFLFILSWSLGRNKDLKIICMPLFRLIFPK